MAFQNGQYGPAQDLSLRHSGQPITPTAIVMHYTVTDTLNAAVNALNSVGSTGLSYHFLIERDGQVHQTRAPTEHAAHAGRSHWKPQADLKNTSSLNRSSVSISFISRGFFTKLENGFAFDTNAHGNIIGASYPETEVERASAPYDPGWRPHWHKYTEEQVASARQLVEALIAEYPTLTELVGHDDISIGGKSDTGPLFPLPQWREELGLMGALGFRTTIQSSDGVAELRRGPSSRHRSEGQLVNGTEIFIRGFAYTYSRSKAMIVDRDRTRYLTRWASVDVGGENKHAGFVHSSLFASTPLHAMFG